MKNKFNIDGMSCSACSAAVEKAVRRIEGVKAADVNLLSKSMVCVYSDKETEEKIISAVEKAGFSASAADTVKPASSESEKSGGFTDVKTRLLVSACFLVPLMYISMGHMLGLPLTELFHKPENYVAFALSQLLLTLPIIYVNRIFFFRGFKALFRRAANMDTLVAVGSSAALIYGIYALYMIGRAVGLGDDKTAMGYISNLYFESAAMILTLVTVGKYLEERAKHKTGDALRKLIDLSPKKAHILRDGKETEIASGDIAIGDIVIIRPGESAPADGVITEGTASFDQSALTGESIPVDKKAGDTVISASKIQNGSVRIRAERVGSETTISRIISVVEEAGASKAPAARLADKISGIFVPVVMTISVISGITWILAGYGVSFALEAAISVLVVSCPCALGLATPVAVTVAMGKCASRGILVKSAEALERIKHIDTAVLDKTGTLTKGKPSVTDIYPDSDPGFLRSAASLESGSEHPLAKAVREHYKGKLGLVEDFGAVFGRGVTAVVDGVRRYGGNADYMAEIGADVAPLLPKAEEFASQGKTPLYFSHEENGVLIPDGIIAVADTVKETSERAVKEMKSAGLKVIMLTGDNAVTAEAIKSKLGIDEAVAGVMPKDKSEVIKKLRSEGRRVAMVGDGINDAPALACADVGISVGNGSDIAIDSADIVLMRGDLTEVNFMISYSARVAVNIKQNLFWAFFYNMLGIPLAAGALFIPFGLMLNPMISAAAMSLSSLFVVTNALRLTKDRNKR
ncbi:MAG: heavy metal translocating P-type ATPase [Oscillospiraceae bacterium]|nr:heavy metal translocating P-type ATPase [Oscillospiraceae bacterium]